jgi:hypothetical protein
MENNDKQQKPHLTIYDPKHPAHHPYKDLGQKEERVRLHPFLRFLLTLIPSALVGIFIGYVLGDYLYGLWGEPINNFVNTTYANMQGEVEYGTAERQIGDEQILTTGRIIIGLLITATTYKIISIIINRSRVALWKKKGSSEVGQKASRISVNAQRWLLLGAIFLLLVVIRKFVYTN